MNGAALAIGAGIWVLAQLFKGQALARLGVIPGGVVSDSSADAGPGFSQGTQTKIPGSA